MNPSNAQVELHGLSQRYGSGPWILEKIDFQAKPGEFIVLLGPSGCGKSTLLRVIAGLENATAGEVRIGGQVVNSLPPADRGLAMVFQDYALYPHMKVRENLAFGLKLKRLPRAEIESRIQTAASLLGLESLLDRKPAQLSGGQRQRVAIGRAIVKDPSVFLFDEPLSNLDAQLRSQTRVEIASLHRRLGSTTIYVTHDQVEAMTLADRILVLKGGRIQQFDSPDEVYHRPANRFVASFIGSPGMNFMSGKITEENGRRIFRGEGVDLDLRGVAYPEVGGDLVLGIRPEAIQWVDERTDLSARLLLIEPHGHETHLIATLGAAQIVIRSPRRISRTELQIGSEMNLRLDRSAVHWFESGPDGRRIDARSTSIR